MNKWKIYIISFIAISIFIMQNVLTSKHWLICISSSLSIVWILWFLFDLLLWKLFSKYGFVKPNFNGSWRGILTTSFDNTERIVCLEIKQTYSSIRISITTDNITSAEVVSGWVREGNVDYLIYSYNTKPFDIFNVSNPPQYGTAKLRMQDGKLKGQYWTSRQTIGSIELERLNK